MPIVGMSGSKSPLNAFQCQSCLDMAVFSDIQIVIKVDKFMISNLPVNRKSRHDHKQADHKFQTVTMHIIFISQAPDYALSYLSAGHHA